MTILDIIISLIVVPVGIHIYIIASSKENTIKKFKSQIERIKIHSMNDAIESKYKERGNHQARRYVTIGGDTISGDIYTYDYVEKGDSISKEKGNTIYRIYRADKRDTLIIDAARSLRRSIKVLKKEIEEGN